MRSSTALLGFVVLTFAHVCTGQNEEAGDYYDEDYTALTTDQIQGCINDVGLSIGDCQHKCFPQAIDGDLLDSNFAMHIRGHP